MVSISSKMLTKLNQYNGFNQKVKYSLKSDKALKGEFIIFGKFDPIIFKDKINWNYKHHHARATYQVYLHCIHIVRDLTNSYIDTKATKYLDKAKSVINDWSSSEVNQSFDSHNSAWKDHSAASRMKNIVYYQTNVPESYKIDSETFNSLVKKHCEFLSMGEHYSENNHGMMSDEALLFLSNFIEEKAVAKAYQEKATLRMERIIYKLFSSNSYNLENSPEYHRLTQNISSRFIRLADMMHIEFDEKCRKIIEKSFLNNRKIVKPDLTYPLIGDTGLFKASFEKDYTNFVDYQAGIAFINSKNNDNLEKSSWLSFKSGYLLTSHKHHDDLSLNYYHNGEDILIDSGKYTYDRKNRKRQFMSSPAGHSTIYEINNKYNLLDTVYDVDSMKLSFVYENDQYIHLAGINHLFDDIKIYRDLIYYENLGFIIVDNFQSNDKKFMGQNFNLHPDIKVKELERNTYELTTKNNKILSLVEHTDRTLNKYFSIENEDRGFYSEKFNEVFNTHQVEYRKNNVQSNFVTSLFETEKAKLENVVYQNNSLSYTLNDHDYVINLQKK